jgi:hypothetical protein
MPLALFMPRSSQGDALIEQYIVANLGSLADHNPHPVIDKEAPPDGRAGVDFDTGQEARYLRNKSGEQRNAGSIQLVGQPVKQHGMKTGIAKNNLKDALRRRVPAEYGIDLFPDDFEHKAVR